MATKSNRLIKMETLSGGRTASISALQVLVAISEGPVPEGYVQNQDMKSHMVCTSFSFKPKLRQQLSEEVIEGVENPTVEDEILDYIIDKSIREGHSISFNCKNNPSRLDFQFRLEKRGFKRWKNKEITYGLTKLNDTK